MIIQLHGFIHIVPQGGGPPLNEREFTFSLSHQYLS